MQRQIINQLLIFVSWSVKRVYIAKLICLLLLLEKYWTGLFPVLHSFLHFLVKVLPSRVWNNYQWKWKVMSKQWAKTRWVCSYCVAGTQVGSLFACASCTPLLRRPSLRFSIFPLVLSIQALPSVSSGMPAQPCPSSLCYTSFPRLGGLAARQGQLANLRGSWHAWWPHSSDLRVKAGGPRWMGVASWALLLTLLE